MLIFSINNCDYKLLQSWEEITLKKAIELHTLCTKEMPGKLKLLYDTLAETKGEDTDKLEEIFASITEEDNYRTFPKFYGRVLECLSNCPADVIEQINGNERTAFYKSNLERIVLGVLYQPFDFDYEEITYFEFENTIYLTPESKTVIGQKRPMFSNTALEFTECADLMLAAKEMAGGKFELAANLIAILCRPEDKSTGKMEKYNEDVSVKRAERFTELNMKTVFNVFFCLNQGIIISRQSMTISSLLEIAKEQRQLQVQE